MSEAVQESKSLKHRIPLLKGTWDQEEACDLGIVTLWLIYHLNSGIGTLRGYPSGMLTPGESVETSVLLDTKNNSANGFIRIKILMLSIVPAVKRRKKQDKAF